MYPYFTLIGVLAVMLLYFILTFNVGRARKKYGIKAPATTGDTQFECVYRVQMNTMEQLILLMPCLGMFSWYVSDLGAMILTFIWIFARILYARAYYQQSVSRERWFKLSILITFIMWLGVLLAIFRRFLSIYAI